MRDHKYKSTRWIASSSYNELGETYDCRDMGQPHISSTKGDRQFEALSSAAINIETTIHKAN
jgi:hypothetical protein